MSELSDFLSQLSPLHSLLFFLMGFIFRTVLDLEKKKDGRVPVCPALSALFPHLALPDGFVAVSQC